MRQLSSYVSENYCLSLEMVHLICLAQIITNKNNYDFANLLFRLQFWLTFGPEICVQARISTRVDPENLAYWELMSNCKRSKLLLNTEFIFKEIQYFFVIILIDYCFCADIPSAR